MLSIPFPDLNSHPNRAELSICYQFQSELQWAASDFGGGPSEALLCVGIIRSRVSREHIAEGSAVGDGDADADGIAVRVDHRCQMAGGVLPVRHGLFRIFFGS